MVLGERSQKNLVGVHPDLVRVIHRASILGQLQFVVTEGVRSYARQKQLVAEGKSRTLHSRHLTGHAVDLAVLVDGKVVWDLQHYRELADQVKDAAELEGVRIEWGGEAFGPKFIDGPHFQLPRSFYPDGD